MRLFIFIISFLILTFSNSWSLFHSKEVKYVCTETSDNEKKLYIFDIKNKKVFVGDKDYSGIDVKIGENYFSWELDGDGELVVLDNKEKVFVDKIVYYLNTDLKQLTVDFETIGQGTKYSVRVYKCNELT